MTPEMLTQVGEALFGRTADGERKPRWMRATGNLIDRSERQVGRYIHNLDDGTKLGYGEKLKKGQRMEYQELPEGSPGQFKRILLAALRDRRHEIDAAIVMLEGSEC